MASVTNTAPGYRRDNSGQLFHRNVSANMGREDALASVNYSSGESINLHGRPLLMSNEVAGKLAAWLPNGTGRGTSF